MILRDILALSCRDLLLSSFIKCMLTEDFKHLIKRKGLLSVKPDVLRARWLEIYQEFIDSTQSGEGAAYLSLMKQRTVLANRIELLENGLKSLSYGYNTSLVKALNRAGLRVKFKKENLIKDLEKAIKQLKGMIVNLHRLDNNIKPFQTGEAMKESDFDEVLAVLSKYQGYRLNADEITVSEYVHVLNAFKKWQTSKK